MQKYVVNFSQVDKDDIDLVGGKGANLGEMVKAKIPVPEGFIVTSKAYFDFISQNKLDLKIDHLLSHLDVSDSKALLVQSKKIQGEILKAEIPLEIIKEIINSYKNLAGRTDLYVAVRSSATAEDLPSASFAGAQQTFLNVLGAREVVESVRKSWASLFEARAIFYRAEKKFDHLKIAIAVPVQKMVQSDESGVMFTIDPVTNDKGYIIIEAIYGLGELIVLGEVTPDHYVVSKKDLSIIEKKVVSQEKQLVKVGRNNKIVKISKAWSERQKIDDKIILALAKIGLQLEKHFFFPQDIEWAIEGKKLYIVQTRPVTTIQKVEKQRQQNLQLIGQKLVSLVSGAAASPGIASGPATIIFSAKELSKIKKGDVLVAPQTKPDFVPAMKRACAVVTDKGGRTSHAAIVSRELGIPAVVGTMEATKIIKNNLIITVDGSKGEVYKGAVKFTSKTLPFTDEKPIEEFLKTATKIYVNLAEPDKARQLASKNVDGVGLLRAEFMIAQLGIHPKKLIEDRKEKIFIDNLKAGIKEICQAFYPRPVVYRATDFKTNEYRNLKGGEKFEPVEENPMLGFRGAMRYIKNPDVFNLELAAIKSIREKEGLNNLWLMIPFVRTSKELFEVKKLISKQQLTRSKTFKLWMMVEIPSNVILLEKFIEVGIDGLSIGSNDLTMLTLGVDRDNQEIAWAYNEQDPSIDKLLEEVIKTAHRFGVTTSICGQAPSYYPDLAKGLIELGITSISANPDAIDSVRRLAYTVERELVRKKDGKN